MPIAHVRDRTLNPPSVDAVTTVGRHASALGRAGDRRDERCPQPTNRHVRGELPLSRDEGEKLTLISLILAEDADSPPTLTVVTLARPGVLIEGFYGIGGICGIRVRSSSPSR